MGRGAGKRGSDAGAMAAVFSLLVVAFAVVGPSGPVAAAAEPVPGWGESGGYTGVDAAEGIVATPDSDIVVVGAARREADLQWELVV